MISLSKSGKIGLLFLAIVMVLFGFFVLAINATLLYKGIDAVEIEPIEVNNAVEKQQISTPTKAISTPKSIESGEELGKLNIPKLNITIPVFHGTTENELQKGVGHVIGTAFPGEKNNTVFTGHRDTVFRHLGNVSRGDIVQFENDRVVFTYKIRKTRIVEADDLTVLVPKPKATLTLSTCYPFTYIGPAKQRFILVADLVSSRMKRI